MVLHLSEILLWLFVINHGIAFGASLYEQRIVVPQWLGTAVDGETYVISNAMQIADTGRRFWGMVTTGPLTLLTLANLVAAWYCTGSAHAWWFGAVVITLFERFATFGYFIPTAVRLMQAKSPPSADIKATALLWRSLNRLRIAASGIAWLAALKALTQ